MKMQRWNCAGTVVGELEVGLTGGTLDIDNGLEVPVMETDVNQPWC